MDAVAPDWSRTASMNPCSPYRGRFAPTPSGSLHFGSLVTALASWLEARCQQGEWLVRIEDIDPPREEPGAAAQILRTLEDFGLTWDGPVLYQSQRHAAYQARLQHLIDQQRAYACSCSRKDLENHPTYPGFCRQGPRHPTRPLHWRLRVDDTLTLHWQDAIQGAQAWSLAERGDVVIRRKDGLWAYQLAVVTDDLEQGITHILRGIDLLDSTPWQLWLQQCLQSAPDGQASFHYAHLPVIVDARGQKLSKQNLAPALDSGQASQLLYQALQALHQQPDPRLQTEPPAQLLQEALHHWQLGRIAGITAISETPLKPA